MAGKNYIKGFAKERVFENGGSIISLSLNLEQLKQLPLDKYGNIKIDVCRRKEIGQYGDTHYVVENTFKAEGKGNESENSSQENDELPF